MQNKIKRQPGYYWAKTKRGVWMIARWWPSLNNGKGFWDTMRTIENDTRGGFVKVDERKIVHEDIYNINLPQFIKLHEQLNKTIEGVEKVVRRDLNDNKRKIERNVKTIRNRKLSESQENNVEISQKVKRHRRKN